MNPSQIPSKLHYKQYTCLTFALQPEPIIAQEVSVDFQHPCPEPYHLPPALTDTNEPSDALYVLQWQQQASLRKLYLRKANSEGWVCIQMNHFPRKSLVSGGTLFLFGREELAMVHLSQLRRMSLIPLESESIIDVVPTYNYQGEAGVYVVYFDKRVGYYAHTYTASSQRSIWQQLKSFIKPFYNTHKQFDFFKILIPNIMAATISDNQLTLFDLKTMSPGLSIDLALLSNEQPSLKWRLVQKQEGYDDRLELYVVRCESIELIFVDFKRKAFELGRNQSRDSSSIPLDEFIGGDIIDWKNSKIQEHGEPVRVEDRIVNFQLGKDTLIYRCFRERIEMIPTMGQLDLLTFSERNTKIISRQMTIWQQYHCKDTQYHKQTQGLSQTGKRQLSSCNSEMNKIVSWKNNDFFKQFIKVGQSIYMACGSSLSILLQINQLQYILDYYPEQLLEQEQKQSGGKSTQQMIKFKLQTIQNSIQIYSYKNMMTDLKILIESKNATRMDVDEQQGPISSLTLTSSLLRDKILFHSRFFRYIMLVQRHKEESHKNIIIVNAIELLSKTYDDSHPLTSALGICLLEKFATHLDLQLEKSQQLSPSYVISKIFENTLPDSYFDKTTRKAKTNTFLQFLLNLLLSNEQNQQISNYLHNFIKQYMLVFSELPFAQLSQLLSQNSSLLSAYLLSHPPQEALPTVLETVLARHNEGLVQSLRDISHLITNQLEVLFEIKVKSSNWQVMRKSIESATQQNDGDMSNKSKIKGMLPEEVVLYSQDESFAKNSNKIVGLLNSCQWQAHLDEAQSIHKKQLSLDIFNQNYQHILELQQILMARFSELLATVFTRLQQERTGQQLKVANRLLDLLEQSLAIYRQYHKLLFGSQPLLVHSSLFSQLVWHISQEEALTSSAILKAPIRVLGITCSRVAISALRLFINSSTHNLQIRQNELSVSELLEPLLCILLDQPMLTHSSTEILYYFLFKLGQERLLTTLENKNSKKLIDQLRERRVHGTLLSLLDGSGNIELSANAYENPFVIE